MKHLYQIVKFIMFGLLLAGCSSKEMFYFSKSTSSFSSYQKVQKTTNLPDSVAVLFEPSGAGQTLKDSPVLTASAIDLEPTPLLKQKQLVSNSLSLPEKKLKKPPNSQGVKNRIKQNFGIEKQLIKPQINKKVHEAALIGFILSVGAIFILLAGSPLAILASLAGAVLGLIGLNKIKKNPDKYSGKGLAWAGIVLGFLIPLSILAFLYAYAGGFS